MLPALSWLAPATVPQADTNMPAPRTAEIARARLNRRNRSRSVIRTSCDPFPNAGPSPGRPKSDGLSLDWRPLRCSGANTATATKLRDEPASLDVGRSGEFHLDCNRFAVVPLIQIAQAIGKIFERSVLRQHERKRTLFERYPHAAWPRLVVMDVLHRFLRILVIEPGLPSESVQNLRAGAVRSARNPASARVERFDGSCGAAKAVGSETTQTAPRTGARPWNCRDLR